MRHRLTHLILSRAVDEDLDAQEFAEFTEALSKEPAVAKYFEDLQTLGSLLREEFPPVQPSLSATLAAMKLAMPSGKYSLLGSGAPWLLAQASRLRHALVRGHAATRGKALKVVGRRNMKLKVF